jgi:hypothetical protein
MSRALLDLLTSGRLVDLILGLVAVEAVVLLVLAARAARGPRARELVANLAAGVFLLLALRAALAGAAPVWIAASLVGALVAHLADLVLRWRR